MSVHCNYMFQAPKSELCHCLCFTVSHSVLKQYSHFKFVSKYLVRSSMYVILCTAKATVITSGHLHAVHTYLFEHITTKSSTLQNLMLELLLFHF